MEQPTKATILFPADLHEQLARRARQEDTTLGELVRRACREAYGPWPPEQRLAAVRELEVMTLPVGDPATMKGESMPDLSEPSHRDP